MKSYLDRCSLTRYAREHGERCDFCGMGQENGQAVDLVFSEELNQLVHLVCVEREVTVMDTEEQEIWAVAADFTSFNRRERNERDDIAGHHATMQRMGY